MNETWGPTSDDPNLLAQRKETMLARMHQMSQMLIHQQRALKALEATEEEALTRQLAEVTGDTPW
jgi:hypothetical protein